MCQCSHRARPTVHFVRVMRVATYNIRHAEGMDGRVDLARIAHVIGILKADVIALQELDRGWERSGGVDQVVELERLTGLSMSFYPTVVRDDGAEYGIAVAGAGTDGRVVRDAAAEPGMRSRAASSGSRRRA